MILTVCLLLWVAVGLLSGEMLMTCTLDMLSDTDSLEDNYYPTLVAFALAAVLSLPWLICTAIVNTFPNILRR